MAPIPNRQGTPPTPAPGVKPEAAEGSVRGILLMAGAMSTIAVIDALVKHTAGTVSPVVITWFYFLGITITFLLFAALRGIPVRDFARATVPALQIFRGLSLVGSLSLLFISLPLLPLAEATTISFLSPLFVAALSGPMLRETVGWHRWGAVIAGLVGAAIVVRPGGAVFQAAALLPLAGAVFFAMFQILTRRIAGRDETLTTLFHTAVVGTIAVSVPLPFFWETPELADAVLVLGLGALGFMAHFLLISAFRHGEASLLAPFNYVRLIWALGLGVALFGQFPDAVTLLGSAIIAGSGLYVLYRETRRRRLPVASPIP